MNPTAVEPKPDIDLLPVHPFDDRDRVPMPNLVAPPDYANDTVLIGLLKQDVEGMVLESRAADPRGDCSGGHADPTFFFKQVALHIAYAVRRLEALTKPVAAEAPPADPAKPSEPPKKDAADKPKK